MFPKEHRLTVIAVVLCALALVGFLYVDNLYQKREDAIHAECVRQGRTWAQPSTQSPKACLGPAEAAAITRCKR